MESDIGYNKPAFMKKNALILVTVALLLSLASCGFTTLTFFLVDKYGPLPDSQKSTCGDYLMGVTTSTFSKESLENTLKELWNDHAPQYPNLSSSSLFKDNAIILEEVSQPDTPTFKDPLRVYIKTADAKKVAAADRCDVVHFKEQLKKTVDVYASTRPKSGVQPYQIVLDGEAKNWECFGEKFAYCTAKPDTMKKK